MFKILLLDADNTLFDFDKTEHTVLTQLAQNIHYDDLENFIQTFLKINHQVWGQLEKGEITADKINDARFKELCHQLQIKQSYTKLANRYVDILSQTIFLIDDSLDILEYLYPRYTLLLATNGLSVVQRGRLTKSGLSGYFSSLIISEEIGVSKPNSAFFETGLDKYSYEKDEVLMIGDSLKSDIAGGINFGIQSCWFNPKKQENETAHQPTFEISHLMELKDLL